MTEQQELREFTEEEIKRTLNELVEMELLKCIYIDGEIKYVNPDWESSLPKKGDR